MRFMSRNFVSNSISKNKTTGQRFESSRITHFSTSSLYEILWGYKLTVNFQFGFIWFWEFLCQSFPAVLKLYSRIVYWGSLKNRCLVIRYATFRPSLTECEWMWSSTILQFESWSRTYSKIISLSKLLIRLPSTKTTVPTTPPRQVRTLRSSTLRHVGYKYLILGPTNS